MKRALVKFTERARPLPVAAEERWDLYGIVVEDPNGREHHFGRGPWASRPYLYVATYDSDGTRERILWAEDVEEPIRTGHHVRDAEYGPRLSPLVRVALSRLAERSNLAKGFAFPEEKGWAVETFQALQQYGREPFDPGEVFVFAAMNGWSLKAAEQLRDFALGIREGRWFNRRPGGRISVPPDRAQRMLEMWREEVLRPA